jgi:hypothetical protein
MDSTFESILASNEIQCPLCSKPDWCLIKADHRGVIFWSLCGRTNEAPAGWERTGTSRDNRGIFRLEGTNHNRKIFPREVQLVWRNAQDGPAYMPIAIAEGETPGVGDRAVFTAKGAPPQICTVTKLLGPSKQGGGMRYELATTGGAVVFADDRYLQVCRQDPTTGDREVSITYQYGAVHQVRRRQWSDRRPWYQGKSKQVRPWHATERGDGPGMIWQEGRGTDPWPLYHEAEAIEAITTGRTLFVCGGEPAVEALRSLGLYATCNAGGENRWIDLYQAIEPIWRKAREGQRHPIVVIWPDYDVTGEGTSAKLLKRLLELGMRAVVADPPEIWPAIPAKGDAVDWIAAHRDQELDWYLAAIKGAVDKAIDRHEVAEVAKRRATNWGAPFNNKGELGYTRLKQVTKWTDDGHVKREWTDVYLPVSNFDFVIDRQVSGTQGAGYLLKVTSTTNPKERSARVWGDHLATPANFQKRLSAEVGESLILRMKPEEFQALLMVRLLEYRQQRGGKAYKMADRIGKQPDGAWVFMGGQYDRKGNPTTEDASGWMWDPGLTQDEGAFKSPRIAPASPNALTNLFAAGQSFFGDNMPIGLLLCGWAAACLNYDKILELDGAFPVPSTFGDPGGGKTELMRMALSITGNHASGLMSNMTRSGAYERLTVTSCLPLVWDDPQQSGEVDELLKATYNAFTRLVRSREEGRKFSAQTPHTSIGVSSNHAIGEEQAATQSRLAKLFVPAIKNGDTSPANYHRLREAMDNASGNFTDLIKIEHPQQRIEEIQQTLVPHLKSAHNRIARSFALLLAYAERVQAIAGETTDLTAWTIAHICPGLNRGEESGDSLRDFLEKIFNLKTMSKVGDWNLKTCTTTDGNKVLALHLNSLWPTLASSYTTSYSKNTITSLLESSGATKGTQRFAEDMASSLDWRRAEQSTRMQGGKISDLARPRESLRRCHMVPWDVVQDLAFFGEDENTLLTVLTDPPNQPQTLMEQGQILLTNDVNKTNNFVNSVNKVEGLEGGDGLDSGLLTKSCLHPDPLLTSDVNSRNPYHESDTADFDPLVNMLTRQNADEPEKHTAPKSTGTRSTEGEKQKSPSFAVGDRVTVFGSPKGESPGEIIEIKASMARIFCLAWVNPHWESLDRIRKVEVPHE